MSTGRSERRLAFQALFQLDAQQASPHEAPGVVAAWMDEGEVGAGLSEAQRERAVKLAIGAYGARAAADAEMAKLAPTWPASRQAAVDRAILRLAHFELSGATVGTAGGDAAPVERGHDKPRMVINDAIELAKEFSTESSPKFVNALLDKVYKRVAGATAGAGESAGGAPE
jgi:N utilization substance protein B